MRGMHLDPLIGAGFEPPRRNTAAREYKRVYPFGVEHGQFEIKFVWRGCYGLPFHPPIIGQLAAIGLDPHQKFLMVARTTPGLTF